jgi:mRNA-degrading endonuclease RelE of RelBE toxin-antitoxin system
MTIVETSLFTSQIKSLLSTEEYRELQVALLLRPEMGAVIPGSGGLRKIRWGERGRTRRGSVRVIYYYAKEQEQIVMLLAYTRDEADSLAPNQLQILRRIIEEEYP